MQAVALHQPEKQRAQPGEGRQQPRQDRSHRRPCLPRCLGQLRRPRAQQQQQVAALVQPTQSPEQRTATALLLCHRRRRRLRLREIFPWARTAGASQLRVRK